MLQELITNPLCSFVVVAFIAAVGIGVAVLFGALVDWFEEHIT